MPNPFKNLLVEEVEPTYEESTLPEVRETLPPVQIEHNEFLLEEIGDKVHFNDNQLAQIKQYMKRIDMGVGLVAAPMICKDEACPFKSKCPIKGTGADMTNLVGKACPVEGAIHRKTVDELARSLGMDLSNEYTDGFDKRMIDDLATITILEKRALEEMSNEPGIGITSACGFTPDGDPIEKLQLNPRVLLIEKLGRVKSKIQQELIATRRSKVAALGHSEDVSKKAADLMSRINSVIERHKREARVTNEDIIEAEFEERP